MDEQRKNAYRYLLYRAMLSIRPLSGMGLGWFRAWNPFYWRREGQRIRYAGAVAYWLHNLASYSLRDFEGFSEEWFWRDFEWLRSDYPQYKVELFRSEFEKSISAYDPDSTTPLGTPL